MQFYFTKDKETDCLILFYEDKEADCVTLFN